MLPDAARRQDRAARSLPCFCTNDDNVGQTLKNDACVQDSQRVRESGHWMVMRCSFLA